MPRRPAFLVILIGIAVGGAACGRASQIEIDQALGITPTPTMSAEQIVASTAAAATAVAERTAAASEGQAATLGDVTRGNRQFTTQCAGCHRPNGPGGDILAPGGAGADVAAETLLPLVREGTGHPVPPGPFPATLLSDTAVQDIAAFIRSRAAP